MNRDGPRRRRPWGCGAGLVLGLLSATADAAVAPTRIASLNLCTDGLLLELAAPEAALSLTYLSRDPALSPHAARASRHAVNHAAAEEIVRFSPELILVQSGHAPVSSALLRRLGYRVAEIPAVASLPALRRVLRRLGELLGRAARAEAVIARLAARLADVPRHGAGATALIVLNGGHVPDADHPARALLGFADLRDGSASLLAPNGGLSLEALVRKPPDWLIVGAAGYGTPAQGSEFLRHPALTESLAHADRLIPVPEMLFSCAGSAWAEAARVLAQGLVRGGARGTR